MVHKNGEEFSLTELECQGEKLDMGENLLKSFRTSRGLSQQALADLLGVARNYIYLIESGRKPVTESIRARLDLLGRDPANSLNELDSEANADKRASNTLADIAARLEALDARVSSVERLLLKLLAEPPEKRAKALQEAVK